MAGSAVLAGAWGRGMAAGARPGSASGLPPGEVLWLLAAAVLLHAAERHGWAPAWLSGGAGEAEAAAAAAREVLVGGVLGAVGLAALGSGPRGGVHGACAAGLVLAGALNHARLWAVEGFAYHPGAASALALLLPLSLWALRRNAAGLGGAALGLAFGFAAHGCLAGLAAARARGDLGSSGFASRLAGVVFSPGALAALVSGGDMLLGLARSKPAPEPADAAEVQAAGGQEAATVPETAAAETKKDA